METIGVRLDALLERIDQGIGAEEIRSDTARLLRNCLNAKGDFLDSWEKMHLEMAIALLPTAWLTLAVTHVKMALEPPEARSEIAPARARQFESITCDQLAARLAALEC